MNAELDAIGYEARRIHTLTGREPRQIRITASAFQGSIAGVPMGPTGRYYEILVHPEDYKKIREETPPAAYAASPLAGEESVLSIPIVRDLGVDR